MISFDVKSLITNVPLEETIKIIIDKIYKEKIIVVPLARLELESLLRLCTKEVEFSFNDELYLQVDGVAMGSPLGPLFANIFMCELEKHIIPQLKKYVTTWLRYVDDAFVFIDSKMTKIVCGKLKLDNKLETTVYRKPTNTDPYINWFSHSPNNWKVGTFTNLVRRAVTICSTEHLFMKEIDHLKYVFVKVNQYPYQVIENIIKKKFRNKERDNTILAIEVDDKITNDIHIVSMTLPYVGNIGETLVKKLKQDLKSKLPVTVKTQITYTATKLGSAFQIKDQTKLNHECKHRYAQCRCEKRAIEHNNKITSFTTYANKTNHTRVWLKDFKILG